MNCISFIAMAYTGQLSDHTFIYYVVKYLSIELNNFSGGI